ncbi:MAG: integrase arm-type DNA-binding domain-containing protein, partial [Desulfovibrio sp.]|nr:integrase arm-type DNA-binding domain-containing protein [Desulfovibrio sp.]
MSEKLTDTKIRSLKPEAKPYTASDGTVGGMVVAVSTAGKKVFRLKYNFQGKAQQLTLGPYPELSLAEAREMALEARRQIRQGIDPAAAKKAEKAKVKANGQTFQAVAEEWIAAQTPRWSAVHLDDVQKILNLHVFPRIGSQPIASVTKADIKAILDTLQAQGKIPTLKKVRSHISLILRHGIDTEIPGVTVDWTTQLRGSQYQMLRATNRAAITDPSDARKLMKAIDSYESTSPLTCLALKFSALTFARPGEIRHAEWTEIDWDAKLWRIPANKMKMGKLHVVPLSKQAIDVLEQLKR